MKQNGPTKKLFSRHMEHNFTTTLGTTSKVITGLLILIGLLIPVLSLFDRKPDGDIAMVVVFIPLFFLIMLGITFIYMPDSYTVSPEGIRVQRRAKDVLIPAGEIAGVRAIAEEEMGFPLRLFGNGGLFGFTGYYSSGKMGRMRWYATQRGNYVLITTKAGKKVIVTPDDPAAMVQAANDVLSKSVA